MSKKKEKDKDIYIVLRGEHPTEAYNDWIEACKACDLYNKTLKCYVLRIPLYKNANDAD